MKLFLNQLLNSKQNLNSIIIILITLWLASSAVTSIHYVDKASVGFNFDKIYKPKHFTSPVEFFPGKLICNRRISGLISKKLDGSGGFKITLDNDEEFYTPDKVHTITLSGPKDFTMFQIVLENEEPVEENKVSFEPNVGKLMTFQDATTRFSDDCPNSVIHTANISKPLIKVMWKAPTFGSSCVFFKATVVLSRDVWYMDDGLLMRRFCPNNVQSFDEQPEILEECEVCEEAKYQLNFQCLWSKFTHPKHFPDKWISYFSDLIGASHNINYRLWEEGKIATQGLRLFVEKGESNELKKEIRKNSKKIRTTIRARGLAPSSLHQRTFAIFRVDSNHHLLSFISKLGPSPDWFVGVSGLELCLKNNSWALERKMNLYLWDAGTNSGLSYLSQGRSTVSHEKIRLITSSYPNAPESPFYDPTGAKLKPFAMVTLKRLRLYQKPCLYTSIKKTNRLESSSSDWKEGKMIDNRPECAMSEWIVSPCIGEPYTSGEQLYNRSYINPVEAKLAKCKNELVTKTDCVPDWEGRNVCTTSDWSEWSPCENQCGQGEKKRKRKFIYPDAEQYCKDEILQETKPCYGTSGCSKENDNEYYPNCETTEWSLKIPCNASCELGKSVWTREYKKSPVPENCKKQLEKVVGCDVGISNCSWYLKEICLKPKKEGPCISPEPIHRWFYNHTSQECESFIFGGCQGNHNNFRSQHDCEILCKQPLSKIQNPLENESNESE